MTKEQMINILATGCIRHMSQEEPKYENPISAYWRRLREHSAANWNKALKVNEQGQPEVDAQGNPTNARDFWKYAHLMLEQHPELYGLAAGSGLGALLINKERGISPMLFGGGLGFVLLLLLSRLAEKAPGYLEQKTAPMVENAVNRVKQGIEEGAYNAPEKLYEGARDFTKKWLRTTWGNIRLGALDLWRGRRGREEAELMEKLRQLKDAPDIEKIYRK